MSDASDKADALAACPACGHAARFHWRLKHNYTPTAVTNEQQLLMKYRDKKAGTEEAYGYASNVSPGNLPGPPGCFKATGERWHDFERDGKAMAHNVYDFCDCPMDQETVLALVRQGKTFLGAIS